MTTAAQTADRLSMFKRQKARAEAFGVEAHIVTASEAGSLMSV